MSVDSSNALIVGGASALISFGFAYFAFKKFISDKFGQGKEQANKLFYWCGLIAMIAVWQGLGTIFNEVLFAFTNNTSIRGDVVARGVVTLLFYPALLALVTFIFSKFSKTLEVKKFADKDHDVVSSPSVQTNSFHLSQKFIFFISTLAILIGGVYFFYNGNFSFSKEKTFTLSNCVNCSIDPVTMQNKCQDVDNWKFFKVSLDKIQVGVHLSDALKIIEHPRDSKEKCSIIHEKNFAFTCTSIDDESAILITSSSSFDGDGQFKSELNQLVKFNGRRITGVTKCTAK